MSVCTNEQSPSGPVPTRSHQVFSIAGISVPVDVLPFVIGRSVLGYGNPPWNRTGRDDHQRSVDRSEQYGIPGWTANRFASDVGAARDLFHSFGSKNGRHPDLAYSFFHFTNCLGRDADRIIAVANHSLSAGTNQPVESI